MTNNWYLVAIIVICLLVGGVIGWSIKPSDKPKETTVKENKQTETIITPKSYETEKRNIIPKPILGKDSTVTSSDSISVKNTISYVDSVKGEHDGLAYKIIHSITESDSILSDWKLDFKWLEKQIKENTSTDSIQTIIETEYISLPFFLNPYFYSTLISIAIIILQIIF